MTTTTQADVQSAFAQLCHVAGWAEGYEPGQWHLTRQSFGDGPRWEARRAVGGGWRAPLGQQRGNRTAYDAFWFAISVMEERARKEGQP